jgi:hypothetical protein
MGAPRVRGLDGVGRGWSRGAVAGRVGAFGTRLERGVLEE